MAEESRQWSLWLGGASLVMGMASFVAAIAQKRLVDAELSAIRSRGLELEGEVRGLERLTKSEIERLEEDLSILRTKVLLEFGDE